MTSSGTAGVASLAAPRRARLRQGRPTVAILLHECIRQAGSNAVLVEAPCLDAWQLFEAGDMPGYFGRLAAHVRDLEREGQADVIVLGQASMAGAIELLDHVRLPVLCSPRLAVTRAVELISRGS